MNTCFCYLVFYCFYDRVLRVVYISYILWLNDRIKRLSKWKYVTPTDTHSTVGCQMDTIKTCTFLHFIAIWYKTQKTSHEI